MRSLMTFSLVALLAAVPSVVSAQQFTTGIAGALAAADLATADVASAISASSAANRQATFVPARKSTRAGLTVLSLSTAVLQGLDAYTTLSGLHHGASEANPAMQAVAGNPAALVAVKSGMAAATIYAAQKMWPRNKVGAIAMLAVTNGVMATVVTHNMQVINRLK